MPVSRRRFVTDPLPLEFADALARARPRVEPLARQVFFFNSIGSTNDEALALAHNTNADGAVVVAEAQTAGRGRQGRTWFSPAGSGLYVSILLRLPRDRADEERATTLLTLAAAVALSEAIEAVTALRPEIKWPNDVLVNRRKIAGILAEAATSDLRRVVLGYGINVTGRAYPLEIRDRATSLESELGRPIDRAMLWAESLAAISARYRDLLAGRFDVILDRWRDRAPSIHGARITWSTHVGRRTGVTAGIDDRGALLVRDGVRLDRIVGGEVIWL